MLTVAETYERLGPSVRSLAGLLHDDADVVAVGAAVRLRGVDHEVRLERVGAKGLRLSIRAGGTQFYRGALASWYGAVSRARRSDGQTGGAA